MVTNGPKKFGWLISDRFNEGFYKKMYGCFAGQQKQVAVITRWQQGGVPLYRLTVKLTELWTPERNVIVLQEISQ